MDSSKTTIKIINSFETHPKYFEDDYTPRMQSVDRLEEFKNSPIWRDILDRLQGEFISTRDQLIDPEHTEDLCKVRYFQGQLDMLIAIMGMPDVLIEFLSEIEEETEDKDDA